MKPKLFPSRFNLLLDEGERGALDALFELDLHLIDASELLHDVLRAGIKALNVPAEAKSKDPNHLTRTQVEGTRRSLAQVPASRALRKAAQQVPVQRRRVELYLGFPITEDLRDKFEDYLGEHPDTSEETAAAFLLDQGLFRDKEVMARFDDPDDLGAERSAVFLKDSTAAARHRRRTRLAQLRAIVGGRR